MARPTNRVTATATMMRHDRSASQRITSTVMMVATLLTMAPSWTVLNSSSAIATGPVRRTRA